MHPANQCADRTLWQRPVKRLFLGWMIRDRGKVVPELPAAHKALPARPANQWPARAAHKAAPVHPANQCADRTLWQRLVRARFHGWKKTKAAPARPVNQWLAPAAHKAVPALLVNRCADPMAGQVRARTRFPGWIRTRRRAQPVSP